MYKQLKRILLASVFIIFLSNLNFAQNKHRLGVIGGPNYFSLTGTDLENTESQYGYFFGFSYEYKLNDNFSLVTGIALDKKIIDYNSQASYQYVGENGDLLEENFTISTVNKYKYFTVPLLLRYSFGKKKSFFANGGVFIAASGKNKKSTKITYQTLGYNYYAPTHGEYNFPLADDISGADYGLSFGIGKIFILNDKLNFLIELRNNLGVANNVNSGATIKTNTLNLIAQLSFDL